MHSGNVSLTATGLDEAAGILALGVVTNPAVRLHAVGIYTTLHTAIIHAAQHTAVISTTHSCNLHNIRHLQTTQHYTQL